MQFSIDGDAGRLAARRSRAASHRCRPLDDVCLQHGKHVCGAIESTAPSARSGGCAAAPRCSARALGRGGSVFRRRSTSTPHVRSCATSLTRRGAGGCARGCAAARGSGGKNATVECVLTSAWRRASSLWRRVAVRRGVVVRVKASRLQRVEELAQRPRPHLELGVRGGRNHSAAPAHGPARYGVDDQALVAHRHRHRRLQRHGAAPFLSM